MNKIQVNRTHSTDKVTLGTMSVIVDNEVVFTCKTMELPWKDNKPQISCIPTGTYPIRVLENSPAFKYKHLSIDNVPNRSGVKIHVANYVRQLRGCIAVGKSHADIDSDGVIDVTSSVTTLKELLQHVEGVHIIEIT